MRKATAPPPPPSLRSHNGNGSLSAEDSDSLSGESLEGFVELSVILPDGQVVQTSVEKRTPMMDLLVQVTKANGLSPGSFVLDVKRDCSRDSILYKPNTPVGSLNTSIMYVVPKASVRDALVRKDSKAGTQPFEKTFRLRVHLPRNQLHVLRVSQNTPLIDIFNVICTERELNSSRYELRHPVHIEERLDPQRCLADYCLSEVAMVSVRGPTSALSRSSSDIMALQQDDDRKKSRFFGFMFRKSKSISKSIGDNSSDGHSSRGVSPARSDGSGSHSTSPPPSTVRHSRLMGASSSNSNNNILSKKRPAPAPPKVAPPKSAPQLPIPPPSLEDHQNADAQTANSHSRHSSDSSGYHEASILSESPEATVHDLVPHSNYKTTIPTSRKMPVATNLTTVNSNSSLSVSSGPKKRKAPAPPPVPVGSPIVEISPVSTPTSPVSPPVTDPKAVVTNDGHASPIETLTPKDSQPSIGKNPQRNDSMSSHASSSSNEEFKVVPATAATKVVTAPVPLPRQSKTPVMCRSVAREEKVMEKISETLVQHAVDTAHIQSDSSSESSERKVNCEDVNNDQPASPNKVSRHEANNMTIVEALNESVIHLNSENDRRSSSSSTDSVQSYSDKKSGTTEDAPGKLETLLNPNGKPCNWTLTEESHGDEVISALRKLSIQSQSSLDSSGETEIAVVQAAPDEKLLLEDSSPVIDETNEINTESRLSISSDESEPTQPKSVNSSHKSFKTPEALNSKVSAKPLSKDSDETNTPLQSGESEVRLDNLLTNDAVNQFYSQLNWKNKFVANSWSQYLSLSRNDQESTSVGEDWVISDDEDLFSPSERQDSATEVDLKTVSYNDDLPIKLYNDEDRQRSSTSLSDSMNISNKPIKMQKEPRVKEADVTALSARIDQTISEHKIAAEIDEAFASIDLMDSGSDSGDDKHSQAKIISSDPVITWEYKIPEVPRQFQNDYEGTEQGSSKSSQKSTDISKEETVTELPPKSEMMFSNKGNAETKKNQQPTENPPNAEALVTKSVTVEKEIDVQVRRTYRKPVVNFSISTYKARDEEEVRYGHKLTKADSFSHTLPDTAKTTQCPSDAKVSNVSDVAPSNSSSLNKPKADPLVPGQSSAIAKVIMGKYDGADPHTVDKIEICDSRPEGGMRKAKSELQLSSQTVGNLSVPNGSTTEQERLQEEYLKLHQQFLQWQQQLLHNQTILQQQQILPESSTETLQRIQQLQQQFMSLPQPLMPPASQVHPAPSTNIEMKDYSQKTQSLPRPKSAAAAPPTTTSNGNSNSLERRLPRVGPRPWRPVAVSVSSWPQRPVESVQDEKDKLKTEKPIQIIPSEDTRHPLGSRISSETTLKEVPRSVSTGEKISPLNSFNNEKVVNVVNRPSAQAPAFRRCPVVKGFAMEPQQKSKVIINSARENPVLNGRTTLPNMPQSINGINSKPGVVRVNIVPKATSLRVDKPSITNNSKAIDNSTSVKSSTIDRVYFGGQPVKPAIQTVTYFGDKVENRSNNLRSTSGSDSTAVQKVANNVRLSKPTRFNYGSAVYNTDSTNKSAEKKFTTVVSVAQKQNSSQPTPPPPPPPLQSISTGQQVKTNIESKKSPISPTATGDLKDELMVAIRGFGGRAGLKKISSSDTAWENRHGKFN